MANNVKNVKAAAFDNIHEIIFHFCRGPNGCNAKCSTCQARLRLLRQFCTPQYWNEATKNGHFASRLIPLNKAHPETPEITNYRPIVVTSSLVKFLEGFILPSLRVYQKKHLHKSQIGFVPGLGIDIGKERLQTILDERKNKNQQTILGFIDFSGAYDRVNRSILYDLIR